MFWPNVANNTALNLEYYLAVLKAGFRLHMILNRTRHCTFFSKMNVRVSSVSKVGFEAKTPLLVLII